MFGRDVVVDMACENCPMSLPPSHVHLCFQWVDQPEEVHPITLFCEPPPTPLFVDGGRVMNKD